MWSFLHQNLLWLKQGHLCVPDFVKFPSSFVMRLCTTYDKAEQDEMQLWMNNHLTFQPDIHGNCYTFDYLLRCRKLLSDSSPSCSYQNLILLGGIRRADFMTPKPYLLTHPLSSLPPCMSVWCTFRSIAAHHMGSCAPCMSEDKRARVALIFLKDVLEHVSLVLLKETMIT